MLKTLLMTLLYCSTSLLYAQTTQRIPAFSNHQVHVWKTIIYPSSKAKLKLHRHDHDRVVVALTDGLLKITNQQGKIHYLSLKQGNSYYLTKDPSHELHTDENITQHPISVVVIEILSKNTASHDH